ncbi:MAG: hypothetical protein PVF58_16010 [Candidatus Methanofastidiosia archaeon]
MDWSWAPQNWEISPGNPLCLVAIALLAGIACLPFIILLALSNGSANLPLLQKAIEILREVYRVYSAVPIPNEIKALMVGYLSYRRDEWQHMGTPLLYGSFGNLSTIRIPS